MATANLSALVTRLGGSDAPDADLLARFAATRDEAAFAELVRRHGGTVFGVCRRVTGNHHLAEDAFQAVFVVLAAKASSLRPRSAVAAWLHGVAFRTSLRARTMADRRRRREVTVETLPDVGVLPPSDTADAVALLDEAIAALPEHYRLPVVLCELEGGRRAEVARKLGIPEGTLSSRLASARKALADRLRNRGVVLTSAGVSLALSQIASAAVPTGLAARAVAAAVAPGCVPAPVGELSSGVMRIMFLHKLKAGVPLVGLLAVVVFAGGLFAVSEPAAPVKRVAQVDAPKAQPPTKPAPAVVGPNKILFYRAGHLTLIDPDGKNDTKVSENRAEFHPGDSKLSPDGKQMAFLVQTGKPVENRDPQRTLYLRGLDEKEPGTDLGVTCQLFAWSPDGTEIACTDFIDGTHDKETPDATSFVVNVKTKEKTPLKMPTDHILTDWSRDGKFFLTTSMKITEKKERQAQLHLMNRDGTPPKSLTDAKTVAMMGRFSPDGKRVLFSAVTLVKVEGKEPRREMAVLDIATGKIAKVEDQPLNGDIQSYCWSPDGKKIAYAWREQHEGKPEDVQNKATESYLVVCDPDGKNAKTIASERGDGPWVITIGHIDWR